LYNFTKKNYFSGLVNHLTFSMIYTNPNILPL